MPQVKTTGRCGACGRACAKQSMARHLASCSKRREQAAAVDQKQRQRARILHLRVEGEHRPEYWMHLEIPADATLLDLDDYLRKVWLECCGHLSSFTIGRQRFEAEVDDFYGGRSMHDARLGEVVRVGDVFKHEYDFGSTTTLRLKVVDEREGALAKDRIERIAVNDPPDLRCACGKPATEICVTCAYQTDAPYFCDDCASEHECEEAMFSPIVNSPRMGVCGYTG